MQRHPISGSAVNLGVAWQGRIEFDHQGRATRELQGTKCDGEGRGCEMLLHAEERQSRTVCRRIVAVSVVDLSSPSRPFLRHHAIFRLCCRGHHGRQYHTVSCPLSDKQPIISIYEQGASPSIDSVTPNRANSCAKQLMHCQIVDELRLVGALRQSCAAKMQKLSKTCRLGWGGVEPGRTPTGPAPSLNCMANCDMCIYCVVAPVIAAPISHQSS